MNYNVSEAKGLFKTYPNLKSIYEEVCEIHESAGEEVEHPLTEEELLAFIVLSYHIKSPLSRELSIHKKRQMALTELGYTIKTEQDINSNPELAKLIIGRNQFVNRLALHFAKGENSFDWLELCRLSDMLDDVFLALKEDASGSKLSSTELLLKKTKLESETEPIRLRIKQLAQTIFAGDDNLLNLTASHVILEQRIRILSPESYAKAMKAADGDLSKVFQNQ